MLSRGSSSIISQEVVSCIACDRTSKNVKQRNWEACSYLGEFNQQILQTPSVAQLHVPFGGVLSIKQDPKLNDTSMFGFCITRIITNRWNQEKNAQKTKDVHKNGQQLRLPLLPPLCRRPACCERQPQQPAEQRGYCCDAQLCGNSRSMSLKATPKDDQR